MYATLLFTALRYPTFVLIFADILVVDSLFNIASIAGLFDIAGLTCFLDLADFLTLATRRFFFGLLFFFLNLTNFPLFFLNIVTIFDFLFLFDSTLLTPRNRTTLNTIILLIILIPIALAIVRANFVGVVSAHRMCCVISGAMYFDS
jgi:hypothetical protein